MPLPLFYTICRNKVVYPAISLTTTTNQQQELVQLDHAAILHPIPPPPGRIGGVWRQFWLLQLAVLLSF